MGYLANIGQNIGQGLNAAEGATTVPGMVGASSAAGVIGTAATSAGQALSGLGQAQQFLYQSQVATHNAALMKQNAGAEIEAGQYGESVSKLRTGERVASQEAAQAANGADVSSGSALKVRQSTATVGALDAAMIHYNAARAAFGDNVAAANLKAQANLDTLGAIGSGIGGVVRGGISAIGGAQSMADKWLSFTRVGAVPAGGN